MLILLGTTLTTSFLDCLNPSAIAQQMLLQAMVKNKRHIWFFILSIALANLFLGLAIYYGIAAWAALLLSQAVAAHPLFVHGAELLIGLLCTFFGVHLLHKTRRNNACASGEAKSPSSLAPLSLFALGAAFCAVELTSALPYFGFLALLASYNLHFAPVLCFMLLYNFVYIFPLVLLYLGYNRLKGTVLIQKLERALSRISAYIVPAVICLVSVLLMAHGAIALL